MAERPVALVTGASRGIGRGIALALAGAGFDVAGNARSYDPGRPEQGLAEVERKVQAAGAAFLPVAADVADLDRHETLVQAVLDRFGRVDVLVNNAGVAPEVRRDLLETTPASFDRVLSINTRGPFFLSQRVARQMMNQPSVERDLAPFPSIVFVTSISAYVSSPSRAEYCLSKAALSQAARVFAHRLAGEGVRVFEVQPGLIRTDMTEGVKDRYDRLIQEGLVPQNRWGTPEDVGRAVASLARGDFGYSTGMVVDVSGGLHIHRL